jgi:predicted RecA/RadA family phage recombinase
MADDYLPKFKPGQAITRTATATITAGQMVTTAGAVAVADSTTWLGVASRSVTTGMTFGVYADGVQRVTASAAVAVGDRVKCAAAGKVAVLTAGSDAYDRLVGIALEAAAADGDVIAVKFIR